METSSIDESIIFITVLTATIETKKKKLKKKHMLMRFDLNNFLTLEDSKFVKMNERILHRYWNN